MEQSFSSLERYSDEHALNAGIILLSHKTPRTINTVIVLVEGEDDEPIISKFFLPDTVDIKPCFGCGKVLKKLVKERKTEGKDDVIAILDSDFRNMRKAPVPSSYIFYTDYHDLEMTIIVRGSLAGLVHRSMNIPYQKKPLLNGLINRVETELFEYSMMKWYNSNNHLFFTIYDPDLQDKRTHRQPLLAVNLTSCFKPESPKCKHRSFPLPAFNNFCKKNQNPDLHQLTNGHDFLCRWAAIIKHETGVQSNEAIIRENIENLFNASIARKTGLYKRISKWATNHGRVMMA